MNQHLNIHTNWSALHSGLRYLTSTLCTLKHCPLHATKSGRQSQWIQNAANCSWHHKYKE
jgi:hypothetical protein